MKAFNRKMGVHLPMRKNLGGKRAQLARACGVLYTQVYAKLGKMKAMAGDVMAPGQQHKLLKVRLTTWLAVQATWLAVQPTMVLPQGSVCGA